MIFYWIMKRISQEENFFIIAENSPYNIAFCYIFDGISELSK